MQQHLLSLVSPCSKAALTLVNLLFCWSRGYQPGSQRPPLHTGHRGRRHGKAAVFRATRWSRSAWRSMGVIVLSPELIPGAVATAGLWAAGPQWPACRAGLLSHLATSQRLTQHGNAKFRRFSPPRTSGESRILLRRFKQAYKTSSCLPIMIPKILFASSFVLGFSLVAQPALAEPGHYICGYTGVVTTDNRCPHGKTPWLISAEPPSPSASPATSPSTSATTSTPPSTKKRGTRVIPSTCYGRPWAPGCSPETRPVLP